MTFPDWLVSTISTGAVLGFIGFLLRNWIVEWLAASIKHKYDKELETHKANLKRDGGANREERIDKFGAEIAGLEKEIPMLLTALEDDFQNILGVHNEEKKS